MEKNKSQSLTRKGNMLCSLYLGKIFINIISYPIFLFSLKDFLQVSKRSHIVKVPWEGRQQWVWKIFNRASKMYDPKLNLLIKISLLIFLRRWWHFLSWKTSSEKKFLGWDEVPFTPLSNKLDKGGNFLTKKN